MEFQRDISPPPAPVPVEPEVEPVRQSRAGGMSFSQAWPSSSPSRQGAGHARVALVTRLVCDGDFNVIQLARDPHG